MRLNRATLVCITAMGALFFAPCDVDAQLTGKPNVLIIVTDDQGYADLSAYEHSAADVQKPNMDRLAKRGVLFTDGHCAASTCTPTLYAFLTGRYPFRPWCSYSALSTQAPLLIDPDRPTIASFLRSHGYATSIIGKWKLMLGQGDCGYREFFGKKPHPAPKPGDPPAQLYDVAADPAEKHNLYAKHPEIVHQLMLTLQKIQAEEGYKPDRPEQPKEQLTIDQLNALFREGAK